MAPRARVTVTGIVRSVETVNSDVNPDTGEVGKVGKRVQVLTEPEGGFMEVYVAEDDFGMIPDVGRSVAWLAEVGTWTRRLADGRSFSQLSARAVADAAASSGRRSALESVPA